MSVARAARLFAGRARRTRTGRGLRHRAQVAGEEQRREREHALDPGAHEAVPEMFAPDREERRVHAHDVLAVQAVDFCWMCLGAWADHGERTGGYYACNRYERAKSSGKPGVTEEENRRLAAKHSLERYTHYYERWAAHGGSQRKALADAKEWERRKSRKLGDLQNTPPSQLRFITDALAQIAECRRVLKWTYGFGYYRFDERESAKKRFFEFAQADAEGTLERLTEAVETELETFLTEARDAAEFGAFRGKLAGLTDITHKYFHTLVVEIEQGFPGVAEEPSPSSEADSENETARADANENENRGPARDDDARVHPRGPDGVIRRISRGIREVVIGNGEGVAARTRARAPDPSGGEDARGER